MSGIDGDRDGSDVSDGVQKVVLVALLDVDEAGARRADVLLLEQAVASAGSVGVGSLFPTLK